MSDARPGARSGSAGGRRGHDEGAGDFQASVARLEKAVEQLVTTASDRASTLIDESSRRLERELDRRRGRSAADAPGDGRPEGDGGRAGYRNRRRRARYADASDEEPVPRRLYRDRQRARICGVCAGIARYYGVEPWVVRCVSVTGLLFFPTIVFPAYWIACFVMDKPPRSESARRRSRRGRHGRDDHRSPSPELGPRFSPRYSLRNVQADLTEVELRLRRMETHVTSGQYELQREFNKIDGGSSDGRSV